MGLVTCCSAAVSWQENLCPCASRDVASRDKREEFRDAVSLILVLYHFNHMGELLAELQCQKPFSVVLCQLGLLSPSLVW